MPILLFIFTFASVAPARTNNPEIVEWAEYQTMTAANQQKYLDAVASALSEFEEASTEIFEADRFASYPYFKDLFARALEEIFPEVHATIADGIACEKVSFAPPAGSSANDGRLCVYFGGASPRCTNPTTGGGSQSSANELDLFVSKCKAKLKADPVALNAYNRNAEITGRQNLTQSNSPVAPNSTAAAATAGVKSDLQKIPGLNQVKPSAEVAKHEPKGCSGVSARDRSKRRKEYKADAKAKCLIGGVESVYAVGDANATCKPVVGVKQGGRGSCTAQNTYGAGGKVGGVKTFKRTMCQSALYCAKTNEPFCVEANGKAFANCETAVKQNAAKLQFGKACARDAAQYEKLGKAVTAMCDNEKARSLLCDDCKAFKAKLDLAESQSGAFRTPRPASPAGGTPEAAY